MKRYVVCGTLLATILGAGAIWQLKHEPSARIVLKPAGLAPSIKITSLHTTGSAPARGSEGSRAAQERKLEPQAALEAKAKESQAVAGTVPAPPTVKSNQYLNELERVAKLTATEREQLSAILRDAADMQRRIDKKTDPERREQLQYKLVQQMIMRLRMVLGEERAKTATAELGPGNPRIEFDERTPT